MAITEVKNLWSGNPVWLAVATPHVGYTPIIKDESADVVIIGAGICGAMIAEELSVQGFSVIILDHRPPLMGSTTASTALLQYEIDSPLIKLREQIGQDKADRAWRRSRLSLENLAARIEALNLRCGMARHDTLYLAGNVLNADQLQTESAARREIGLDCFWRGKDELHDMWGIERDAAIHSYNNIAVNPRRMTAGFLRTAQRKGLRIFSPASVDHIEPGVGVHTAGRPVVKGPVVICATGYEILKSMAKPNYKITSSWVIATRPQRRTSLWPGEVHIWEASDPYIYVRTTPDHRIVCGGEDEEFSDEDKRDALISAKTESLQQKLQTLFPCLDVTPEFSWAGCFGETPTGLPLIGEIPGMKDCYAVMAFGGNGITFARVAAEMLATRLTGGEDRDADIFAL